MDQTLLEFISSTILKGHNFTACGILQIVEQEVSGHGITVCGKMQMVEQEASGHDFSRAAKCQ
jgi:hypothetical protein